MVKGEIWWANPPDPSGSEPGFRRPVVIIQSDAFNKSAINTVICAVITSNTKLADAPGAILAEPPDLSLLERPEGFAGEIRAVDILGIKHIYHDQLFILDRFFIFR